MFFQRSSDARFVQYIAALNATLSITCAALFITWPSPTLPKLMSSHSPIGITITESEASWIASSYFLGSIPGGIISWFMLPRIRRKTTLLVSAAPMFAAWVLIIFAKSPSSLCIARVIAGIGGCIAMSVVPIYIGEISDKDIRGKLGTTFNMLKITGSLFVLSVGPFLTYRILALSCSLFPILFACTFYFMPESPYYLVKINQMEEARRNLTKLSASSATDKQIQVQLDEIARTIEFDTRSKSNAWDIFVKCECRKALVIMIGIKILQQFSGASAMESYMETIIKDSKSSISPEVSSVIFGVIQIPAVLVAACLVDRIGRRLLLIISTLGCALALFAEGFYFYIYECHIHAYVLTANSLKWLPTMSVVLFLIMNPIGLFTLPYVLLGEMFPTNVKSQAVSLLTTFGGTLGFLVVKFFDSISIASGMYTTFWFFGTICVLGAIFVYYVLPETKGKSFLEIQNELNKNKSV